MHGNAATSTSPFRSNNLLDLARHPDEVLDSRLYLFSCTHDGLCPFTSSGFRQWNILTVPLCDDAFWMQCIGGCLRGYRGTLGPPECCLCPDGVWALVDILVWSVGLMGRGAGHLCRNGRHGAVRSSGRIWSPQRFRGGCNNSGPVGVGTMWRVEKRVDLRMTVDRKMTGRKTNTTFVSARIWADAVNSMKKW